MLNIAICDDSVEDAFTAKRIVKDTLARLHTTNETVCYQSAEEIEYKLIEKKEFLDILVLDIDMPEISGLELAEDLRRNNLNIIIIFLSNHDEFVFRAIEFQPFRYIRKSRLATEMPIAIEAALKILENRKDRQIVINAENGTLKTMISEIMYFEMLNRKLYIHLSGKNIITACKKLMQFQKEIDDENVIMIHKSCIVNSKYINKFNNTEIILSDGEKLPVSRLRIKQVKEHIAVLWNNM